MRTFGGEPKGSVSYSFISKLSAHADAVEANGHKYRQQRASAAAAIIEGKIRSGATTRHRKPAPYHKKRE